MKIIVNVEAASARELEILSRVKEDALASASERKPLFNTLIRTDELNGLSIDKIKAMISEEFEGTVVFRHKWERGDGCIFLEIV
jgi:hypothetical protein